MAKVEMQTNLDVSPEKVWELIGGFNALPDWHPAIEKSELDKEGKVRKLSLAGGGTIVEKLDEMDDDKRVYSYSITDSPLPVSNYTATITVKEGTDGENTVVDWSSTFDAKNASMNEAMETISEIYQAGFDNLKKIFGG